MRGKDRKKYIFFYSAFDFLRQICYNIINNGRSGMAEHEHGGHRQRLLKKVENGLVYEHEYLEALLFNAQPRKNTNDIAHRLLAEFGTVENVLRAPIERLMEVEGVGKSIALYLHCTFRLCDMLPNIQKEDYPEIYEHNAFLAYVKAKYGRYRAERLDVYCLDGNSVIYRMVSFTDSDVGKVSLSGESVGDMLANVRPSGIVLVHNHPQGNATPSEADDKTTEKVQILCALQNVLLCDHYVYAPDGVFSYRESGRLHGLYKKTALSDAQGGTP